MNVTRDIELTTALADLGNRLANACVHVGRDPAGVRLLPVTKFFPATDVRILYELGCREFGESRAQEAVGKVSELTELADVHWHMIGRLQRNKLRAIAEWAYSVQSVDNIRSAVTLDTVIATALEAELRHGPLRVLLQVSLDGDPARGGVAEAGLGELADIVARSESLLLAGVMAIAPLGVEPERAFAELARLHERLLRDHPAATERSAGMSGDLEAAVAYGSTCVRVGTALMGARPIIST